MSNFEHRITEDSTEFEKAFLKIYDGSLWNALDKMKDWQPPKPLVVVPQCVADWFEKNEDDLSFKIWGYLINWKLQDKKSDFLRWMKKESECIEILIRMQDGYTVEKEQLYCLKHIDLSDTSKSDVDYFLCDIDGSLGHLWETKGSLPEIERAHFTQSEIDKLHIGSYEQIPVEMSDNGI